MRIGYMYDLHAYPPRGGNHVHALELVRGFVEAGHKVSVLDDPTMPAVTNYSSKNAESLREFIGSTDVLYIRIDARFLRRWSALKACMALSPDVPIVWEINAPANEALAYSWLGGRNLDCPEGVLKKLRRWVHAKKQTPAIFFEERYRRSLAKKVDAAICVSSALGCYASKGLGINSVLALPNGGPLISEKEILARRAKRTDHRFTVFYSGSTLYPWQGLDFIAQVIKLADQAAIEMRFVLAVNQLSEVVPNSPRVEVLEHLDREGILDAICASDAGVAIHPDYPWSPYGFHNSLMKLFEYMACMCPVLTSNHGQMKELFRHQIDCVHCDNTPEDILEKLCWIRDNPTMANAIGVQGWLRIQNEFSWKGNVEKTLAIFDKVIAE